MNPAVRKLYWGAVVLLLCLQAVLALSMVHRESATFDEGDHSFAGYMMWHAHDYGLNPEHPPLAKLLAAAPLAARSLWVPPLAGQFFKNDAYLQGRDWLDRNNGPRHSLIFTMRASVELLALGLCAMVFFAARRWFGDVAGLIALVLVVFDPNVLANSALVTTDVGVSVFFLASVWGFHHWVTHRTAGSLLLTGAIVGLLLATKHSGILLAPMLVVLIAYEVWRAAAGKRRRELGRLLGAVAAVTVVAVLVLWAFYGFRYAARPDSLAMNPTLAVYAQPLKAWQRGTILTVAHLHLLPESYLMGVVDVKRMAEFYPTFLFGQVHANGVPYYFPAVILIKTTLGLLGLLALAVFALLTRRLVFSREVYYIVAPALVYLLIAMGSGMNIGSRHLLPVYTFAIVLAAAAAATLMRGDRGWKIACAVLLAAAVISPLLIYPREMTYANEAWGGARNTHNLLSDANVDWAQQLPAVRHWQDLHPGQECWFAYFAWPELDPAAYGITCHKLAESDTGFFGGYDAELTPPQVNGALLISAGDLSGCEFPDGGLNPYKRWQHAKPDEVIDGAVYVWNGTHDLHEASALARAQHSAGELAAGHKAAALQLAQQAAAIDPEGLTAQTSLGDAAAANGNGAMARTAYTAALALAGKLQPGAQPSFVPDLNTKLAALPR